MLENTPKRGKYPAGYSGVLQRLGARGLTLQQHSVQKGMMLVKRNQKIQLLSSDEVRYFALFICLFNFRNQMMGPNRKLRSSATYSDLNFVRTDHLVRFPEKSIDLPNHYYRLHARGHSLTEAANDTVGNCQSNIFLLE